MIYLWVALYKFEHTKSMKKDLIIPFVLAVLLVLSFTLFSHYSKNKSLNREEGQSCCLPENFTGLIDSTEKAAIFEGKTIDIPQLAFETERSNVLGVSQGEKWVEVDLSEQKLKAWEGNSLFLETLVSTGLPWYPTPQGEFHIWIKLRAAKMEGGSGKYYYYLPNVPYVMYFQNDKIPGWRGYGLHGTYWHDDFGTQRSHGCVNLPTSIAEQLYYWTTPNLPEGKSVIRATSDNPGTRIVIHQ